MFGNKNSAVPYVRIGGVDRQSVLTSNANGNTPVKEIGVNANGNLIFSTDLATFKSVLDLKYSQFKSNDENQDDTWETQKSVSMRASGTLEDGTATETGVVVSKEHIAMVNASMKDNTSTASQISVSNNDATIYSTDGNSATYLTVTPTGAKVNDKEIATTDKLPNLDNYLALTKTTAQSVAGQIIFNSNDIYCSRGIKNKGGDNIAGVVANHMTFGATNFTARILGNTVRPKYATVYSTSSSDLQDLALLSDVPSVQQSTGTSTTATMSQNAITSAIPTKTSQLTNDSNFATTSQIPDTSGFVPNTRTINSKALSSNISLSNKDVGALPDYTINISYQTAGNPRIVKFVSVNYASAATCFKMGAMTCHNDGYSYQFLTDMLIAVTTSGVVTANIYKFAQSSIGNVDGVARYTGDVFYVNDTTNKIVDFYILCGQYSESQFTPVTKVGSTTIAYVTQYSGTATYYSSGDKTWANGCGTTYARLSDIPTKTSQLTNDSNFATTSQIPTFEYDEATKTLNIITG